MLIPHPPRDTSACSWREGGGYLKGGGGRTSVCGIRPPPSVPQSSEREHLKAEVERLGAVAQAQRRDAARAEQGREEHSGRYSDLEDRMALLQGSLVRVQGERDAAEARARDARAQAAGLEGDLAAAERALAGEREAAQATVGGLLQEIEELRVLLEEDPPPGGGALLPAEGLEGGEGEEEEEEEEEALPPLRLSAASSEGRAARRSSGGVCARVSGCGCARAPSCVRAGVCVCVCPSVCVCVQ